MAGIPNHGDVTQASRSQARAVVGVSATVNSLAWSVRSTFALFYVAVLGEFGWRRGDAALGYSLSWLLLLVFSPLFGRLSDRWGARLVLPPGVRDRCREHRGRGRVDRRGTRTVSSATSDRS
jgi:MFS family permease